MSFRKAMIALTEPGSFLTHSCVSVVVVLGLSIVFYEILRWSSSPSSFCTFQGKLDDAKPLYKRALAIREQKLDPDHPEVATSLNNLADLLMLQVTHRRGSFLLYCFGVDLGTPCVL